MAFPMTRSHSPPPPPAHGDDLRRTSNLPAARSEVDILASALHNALSGLSTHARGHPEQDSTALALKQQHGPSLDIILASDLLTLRGVGVDVAPMLMSGHVVLNLTEATSIKALTLQFRGKARLPTPASESMGINNSALTYLICNHEWSFLEGERKHSHTLKAGRHLFPFQLRIGGSLPSSISTSAFGGASVAYKLRATAVRPGLAHNLQTQIPVSITRSFTREALEYQQTLEIENTWPEKLMYSIMIPHKAWAASDTVIAVVKFSPLAKGARVVSVNTTLNETVKLFARQGWQETTKTIVSSKHEIMNGRGVCVDHQQARTPRHNMPTHSGSYNGPHSMPSTPGGWRSGPPTPGTLTPGGGDGGYFGHLPSLPQTPYSAGSSNASYFSPVPGQSSAVPEEGHASVVGPSSASSLSDGHRTQIPVDFEVSDQDVVSTLEITIPHHATPTHALEPIVVSHRIRWSILIANLDGHTSELRCSLPLHVLDGRLLEETLAATATTRRLLLGGPEVPEETSEELELPSYSSHVRDRIANQYLPEQAVMRVTNPWVQQNLSPVHQDGSMPVSGVATPVLEAHYVPFALNSQHNLEYVNSELLLSLTSDAPPALEHHTSHPTPSPHSPIDGPSPPHSSRASRAASRVASRIGSRAGSRTGSRAASPERHSSGSNSPAATGAHTPAPPAPGGSTFVHAHSTASRNLQGLFQNSMKPFTHISPFTRTHHPPPPTTALTTPGASRTPHGADRPVQIVRQQPNTSTNLLHRAFTEVPDYGIASRGFLGGIPPLESYAGLPSYEQSEGSLSTASRSMSAPDLAGTFASVRGADRAPARVQGPPTATPSPASAEA